MASDNAASISFLIVEDDPVLARSLGRYVALFARPQTVGRAEEARRVLREDPDIAGAIFDVGLPDGNGLDLVAEVRRYRPRLPVLVLTGQLRADYVNRSVELGARFVSKYDDGSRIAHIVMQFAASVMPSQERLTLVIEDFCRTHDLTDAEAEVVRRFVLGVSRDDLAQQIGVNENTLKTRVRHVLRKCRARSLEEIFRLLFYSAFGDHVPLEQHAGGA